MEIRSRGHKHQTWNPVMGPAPQAGRDESRSSCTKFPGLHCGLVSRASEISPQPAIGRNQVTSAAWPRGHSLRASKQYTGAPLLRVLTAPLQLLGFRHPLHLLLSDIILWQAQLLALVGMGEDMFKERTSCLQPRGDG